MSIQPLDWVNPNSQPTVLHDQPSLQIKPDQLSLTWSGFYPEEIRILCQEVINLTHKPDRPAGLAVKSNSRYAINATFQVSSERGLDQTVLLQTGRYGRIGADIRLDYNPKCGRAGFHQIRSVLGRVLPREDLTVFLRQAKVTRLDLAIDLPDLTLNDAIVRLKSTRKHGVYTSPRGEPETTYLGGARSNRAVAYNKPADCKAMPSRLRIERRLKPGVRLPELVNLPNPFSGVIAVATAPLRPLITEIHPDILFDSMRTRGIQRALNLLSSPQRRILTAAIDDPANSVMPSVDDLWQQWPQVLRDVGLCFPEQ